MFTIIATKNGGSPRVVSNHRTQTVAVGKADDHNKAVDEYLKTVAGARIADQRELEAAEREVVAWENTKKSVRADDTADVQRVEAAHAAALKRLALAKGERAPDAPPAPENADEVWSVVATELEE